MIYIMSLYRSIRICRRLTSCEGGTTITDHRHKLRASLTVGEQVERVEEVLSRPLPKPKSKHKMLLINPSTIASKQWSRWLTKKGLCTWLVLQMTATKRQALSNCSFLTVIYYFFSHQVVDLNNGLYRCEKCNSESQNFKWRLMLSVDFSLPHWYFSAV